jgi:hypothetical protein
VNRETTGRPRDAPPRAVRVGHDVKERAQVRLMPPALLDKVRARRRTLSEARLVLLQERGSSLSDIARGVGKTLSYVSRVNSAERRSMVIERAIARRLSLPLWDAFPEWYPAPKR